MKNSTLSTSEMSSAINQRTLSMNQWMVKAAKRLTNVSPFVLLLVPILAMMTISFTFDAPLQDEAAVKTNNTKAPIALIKVASNIVK